jgi:predicted carbohydrate-binding protein with CBM5 and CBM33 domain
MKRKIVTLAVVGVLGIFGAAIASRVAAHGSMQSPASRSYACYREGPESPRSAACQAAVAAGGTQPLYDWHEVNIAAAAGRHREIIPDGHLCSAGRDKYRGLDLARADWPSTSLAAGADTTFSYVSSAPHRGSFELYVTRDGYRPTEPLRWADLEATPFARATDPTLAGGAYQIPVHLPAKTGHHLIYSIWQRSDSPEAFYTCSDVDFGGGSSSPAPTSPATTAGPTPTPTPRPATDPPTTPAPGVTTTTPSPASPGGPAPAWAPWTAYRTGDHVSHLGRIYTCRQSHTSQPDWAPAGPTLALWLPEAA